MRGKSSYFAVEFIYNLVFVLCHLSYRIDIFVRFVRVKLFFIALFISIVMSSIFHMFTLHMFTIPKYLLHIFQSWGEYLSLHRESWLYLHYSWKSRDSSPRSQVVDRKQNPDSLNCVWTITILLVYYLGIKTYIKISKTFLIFK